jgi:hypothetical protein
VAHCQSSTAVAPTPSAIENHRSQLRHATAAQDTPL